MPTPINLPETSNFDAGVYALQSTDAVQGQVGGTGPVGVSNAGAQNLTNRTRWLYNQVAALATSIAGLAPIASPTFTGSPTVPTPPTGDNSNLIADTAFVQTTANGVVTINVASVGSTLTLSEAQAGVPIIILTGALAANLTIVFPAGVPGKWTVVNSTSGAYTVSANVAGSGAVQTVAQGYTANWLSTGTVLQSSITDIVFPYLRGLTTAGGTGPIADTPPTTDNSARIITSAWLRALFAGTGNMLLAQSGFFTIPTENPALPIIVQWGPSAFLGTTTNSIQQPLPTPFQSVCWGALAVNRAGAPGNAYSFNAGPGAAGVGQLSNITIECATTQNGVARPTSASCFFIAIGQ
jgi:hypothetical protein